MQGHSFGVNLTKEAKKTVNPLPVANPMFTNEANAESMYAQANDLFSKGKFNEALIKYQHIMDSPDASDQVLEDSNIKAARCLFETGEYPQTLQILTEFIGKYPKSSRIAEALIFLGLCYERMNRPDKAMAFYDKALLFAPALAPKIQELKANLSK